MKAFPIKLIGTKLRSTLSAEALKKPPSRLVPYPWLKLLDRPRYERKYGWRDERLYSEFRLHHPSNCSLDKLALIRKLEETDGFYVDGEPRFEHSIHGFYRVYPYYEWDPTQIQRISQSLEECCMGAVTTHNKRTDDHLRFHKLVSANMLPDPVKYFITFKAYVKGQSSREYVTRGYYSGSSNNFYVDSFRPALAPGFFSYFL